MKGLCLNIIVCILNLLLFAQNAWHKFDFGAETKCPVDNISSRENKRSAFDSQSTRNLYLVHLNKNKQHEISRPMSGRLGAWWFWKESTEKEIEDPDQLRARLQPVSGFHYPTSDEECRDSLHVNQSLLYKPPTNNTAKVGMCVTVRNGGKYLKEWVAYHVSMGVSKIEIYDDHSTDHPQKILKQYVDSGIVEFRNMAGEGTVNAQLANVRSCYRNFLFKRHATGIEWVVHIDIDEYLMPQSWEAGQRIGDLLPTRRFLNETPLCVEVGRVQYGSSFHMQIPPGLTIHAYTFRSPKIFSTKYNKLPKILVNLWPQDDQKLVKLISDFGIHGTTVNNYTCQKYQTKDYGLRINHYIGSASDWMLKVKTHRTKTNKFHGGFTKFLPKDFDDVHDENALPYVCQVKNEMGLLSVV